MGARLFAEFMEDGRDFNAAKLTRLHRILNDLGMSPVGRGSLDIPKEGDTNPFDMLDQECPSRRGEPVRR